MGYCALMISVDALIMGRTTFETVLGFGIDWPYSKPVYVLSTTLNSIPKDLEGKVEIVNGTLQKVLDTVHSKGLYELYIDGGRTIQSFLKEDLIDEMILITIPKLLGGGVSLFGEHDAVLDFKCIDSKVYLDSVVQNKFVRK